MIVVFGGSGYVGAHVDKLLTEQGYKVVSVSCSSPQDQAAKVAKILGSSPSVKYISLDASTHDLSGVMSGADAVVSCVGIAPGSANQREGNGTVNVRIADAAKAAGVKRFVYICIASSLVNGPAKFLLGDYFKASRKQSLPLSRTIQARTVLWSSLQSLPVVHLEKSNLLDLRESNQLR
jgi:nucleoside-diphosphate-sugar epimerase